jgi:hypothetical protein
VQSHVDDGGVKVGVAVGSVRVGAAGLGPRHNGEVNLGHLVDENPARVRVVERGLKVGVLLLSISPETPSVLDQLDHLSEHSPNRGQTSFTGFPPRRPGEPRCLVLRSG